MARDLDDLNEQVKAKLEELIDAPFTATERSSARRQMFEDEEREYLGRLPLQSFCLLDICVLVVDRGHCVRISGDGHRYSTPPEDTGKRVSVTITETRSTSMTWIHGAKRRAQAIKEHTGQYCRKTDVEKKYRRQPREWGTEFVKAGVPEDFADRLVRHLKKEKPTFLAAELVMP